MEAIKAFEAIEDDAACASQVSRALDDWPSYHARLRELRQRRVQALKEQGKTWKEIGALIGVTASRAQQIGAGLRGAKRPSKKGEQTADE
ncbi:hypothetical protein [Streptomyces sp. WMMC897]|uniref:hypothetical protein n=1 Tax=Streptomyces sp. WMMC897 TaxID=3014782 RepID=UPI0022B6F47C|nr:hypothetical protein [Streptomyces sp. WMMC897]MCZ7413051.1 hypothetical protein [Streptomyces sp. WMMC897]MCZ7413139.1 hypothetical protein [Streptomyces sp. WMMC897]MCZ7415477.1 hypothetical protein [Streptomyces sp. WMMC897]